MAGQASEPLAAGVINHAWANLSDLEGKLDVLRVECTKCVREGRYSVRKLIEKYGRKANMMKWREQLNGDCPKRDAHSMHERYVLTCPRFYDPTPERKGEQAAESSRLDSKAYARDLG